MQRYLCPNYLTCDNYLSVITKDINKYLIFAFHSCNNNMLLKKEQFTHNNEIIRFNYESRHDVFCNLLFSFACN